MKTGTRAIVAITALVAAHAALGQTCGSTNLIEDPADFEWQPSSDGSHWVGTMEIRETSEPLVVGNGTINTRVYGQPGQPDSIPGPTLRMTPGETYVLQFRNRLPYQPRSTEHNVFKDPNVSNLHTHGLHISGEGYGDDVTRNFEGGGGGDFLYEIPSDHMGGTYWYHAHHHGSTYLQVSGGAFGLIVVDDAKDEIPDNVAAMEERELVVAYLDPDVAGTGGDTLITGSLSPTWTVNGKVQGDVCMPPDTWQHWRLLLADRDAREKTVSIGGQCEMALLARDGVWRTVAPLELTSNSISLTGASRADLAVRCTGNAPVSVGNTVVANIVLDGSPNNPGAHPWNETGEGTWSANRPGYLEDLRGELVVNANSINMGARTINGSKFDKEVPTFTFTADEVQEFTLKGATNHPFHLHIYHVQVQEDCGDFEAGEWYDVISGNCRIRFDLRPGPSSPYEGRTIMHCHILEHEDQGAMGWIDVLGGASPPLSWPAGFEAVYDDDIEPDTGGTLPAAPTALAATALSSSEIELNWSDNSNDEDTFEIEEASGGGSFQMIDFVTADTTTYTATGLSGNSTYDYRVRATNAAGSSDYSNVASATTDPANTPTAIALGSITLSTVSPGQGWKYGRAVVVAIDDTGAPLAGATVEGAFSGTFSDGFGADWGTAPAGPTAADGSVVIDTDSENMVKGKVTLEFCVTRIDPPAGSALASFTATYGDACGVL